MNTLIPKLYLLVQNLRTRDDGQDLAEYALTFALISLGCITSLQFLASGLCTVFSDVGQMVQDNIT